MKDTEQNGNTVDHDVRQRPEDRGCRSCHRGGVAVAALAAEKKDFKVAWSIYVGWMPWGYAADTGIVKKWADKYGINIEVKQFTDCVESINQYT